jgi:hypothetical protein
MLNFVILDCIELVLEVMDDFEEIGMRVDCYTWIGNCIVVFEPYSLLISLRLVQYEWRYPYTGDILLVLGS